jgi:hypothetical protein
MPSGGMFPKATSLRMFFFSISLMEGFISAEETLCQSDPSQSIGFQLALALHNSRPSPFLKTLWRKAGGESPRGSVWIDISSSPDDSAR